VADAGASISGDLTPAYWIRRTPDAPTTTRGGRPARSAILGPVVRPGVALVASQSRFSVADGLNDGRSMSAPRRNEPGQQSTRSARPERNCCRREGHGSDWNAAEHAGEI
jgi:hypothetical protein